MNTSQRIKQLEQAQQAKEPNDNKIWVYVFGEDGRVAYGSDELIGMTRKEVTAHTGGGNCIHVIRASEDKDGVE